MDTVDAATRSRIMAAVGQKHTAPEVALRKALHASGIRYALHRSDLPGSPDIVCARYKAVIFVHGCFWHGHGCGLSKIPASRAEFWRAKFDANRSRDARNEATLLDAGWRVATVWQCALVPRLLINNTARITRWLQSSRRRIVVGSLYRQTDAVS